MGPKEVTVGGLTAGHRSHRRSALRRHKKRELLSGVVGVAERRPLDRCNSGCTPQAHCGVASNLSLRSTQPTRQLSGSPPGPRQRPFGPGQLALSAGLWFPLAFRRAAFASWVILYPLRDWAVLPKIVRLTGIGARPHRGCRVPRSVRCSGGGRLLYCGAWVSVGRA
jgi:hypothetical protein